MRSDSVPVRFSNPFFKSDFLFRILLPCRFRFFPFRRSNPILVSGTIFVLAGTVGSEFSHFMIKFATLVGDSELLTFLSANIELS